MKPRWNRVVLLSILMMVIALPSITAAKIVEIRLNTRFAMYSASDITLEGDGEKRVHELYFKGVPAGRYSILAAVLTAHAVRGSAVESFDVISMEQ